MPHGVIMSSNWLIPARAIPWPFYKPLLATRHDTRYNVIIALILQYTEVFETYFPLETTGHHDSSATECRKATLKNSNLYAIDKNLDFTSAHFNSNVVPTSASHEPVCACQGFRLPSFTLAHFRPLKISDLYTVVAIVGPGNKRCRFLLTQ